VPELALRFVLANPSVDVCLSGMSTMEQVEENIRTANDSTILKNADKAAIEDHLDRLRKMAQLYCTGCRYCMPCPSGVDVPAIFDSYNLGRVYGLWDIARKRYAERMAQERENHLPATACAECGECEEKCPQEIAIREQLREAHAALAVEAEKR
jgi:predicted aldo/keto reductase-like oxidoreductase